MNAAWQAEMRCPVCGGKAAALDVVDFNKSCAEGSGTFLPISGIPIYYYLCAGCGFCFAPEMHGWSPAEFAAKVYNDDYVSVDPDWVETRPRGNAEHLFELFPAIGADRQVRHLDYGGGIGLMSDLLQGHGWRSRSYDPFVDKDVDPHTLGKFDLITSFEVFEHVPDSLRLIADLDALLADDGLIYFSTLLNEGSVARSQRLGWWYAAPRNGHISLFSSESLRILGRSVGLNFGTLTPNLHVFWRQVPPWAAHLFKSA
jgi:SAM-dependent methyltransferase